MNAFKEFAIGKFVLRFYKTDHVWTCTVTEDMLDEVKKELALQKLSDISQEIENEPVAWMTENGTIFDELPPISGGLIPLYTHPNEDRDSAIYATGYWKGVEYKRMRELTDEEIEDVQKQFYTTITHHDKDFARAILKKAIEK
jgi:hypothetical protein